MMYGSSRHIQCVKNSNIFLGVFNLIIVINAINDYICRREYEKIWEMLFVF